MTGETIGNPIDLTNRKIGVGFPCGDTIPVEFHNSIMQLVNQSAQFVPLGLTNSQSSRIARNRNVIVENARALCATDILWMDADIVAPVQSLMQLLMQDKDIVCATTCRRKGNDRSAICVPMDIKSIEPHQKLVKMQSIGFPFMLIKMAVFDKIDELGLADDKVYFAEPPRWMMKKIGWELEGKEGLVSEDEYFCYLARKAGYDIWCDMELSMQIGHVGSTVFYISNPQESSVIADEKL